MVALAAPGATATYTEPLFWSVATEAANATPGRFSKLEVQNEPQPVAFWITPSPRFSGKYRSLPRKPIVPLMPRASDVCPTIVTLMVAGSPAGFEIRHTPP